MIYSFLRWVFAIFLLLSFVTQLHAQELNCNVIVDDERVASQERQIFRQMEQAILQFMNTTKWTDDEFREEERIKCNILITLGKRSTLQNFEANVQIQSLRPVYGTDYETPVLNFFDNKWQFEYNISQPLIFSENTFTTELTSLLAFYAYVMIGMDYDTFSEFGGNAYYERALNIANNSQQGGGSSGWTSLGDTRDRYWVTENLNNPQFQDYRKAMYQFHRLGLDKFEENPVEARQQILGALELIKGVRDVLPTAVMLNAFFDAKGDELIRVYSRGNGDLREKAATIMTECDPANSNEYRKLLK